MHIKASNIILSFLIASAIILAPQTSLAAKLKNQGNTNNIDSIEVIADQNKSPDDIFLADSETMKEAIDSLNAIKSETISSVFGSKFISELNDNGFFVGDETTMEELCNMHDPHDFITNSIANHPQIISGLLNNFRNKRTNTTSISASRRGLGIFNKLILGAGILAAKLPSLTAQSMPTKEMSTIPTAEPEPMEMMKICSSYAYNATMMAKDSMSKMMWNATLTPKYLAKCCQEWMPDSNYKMNPMHNITAEQLKMVSNKICSNMPEANNIPLIAGAVAGGLIVATVIACLCCRSKRACCFSKPETMSNFL